MSNAITVVGWALSTLISLIFLAGAYTQFTFDPAAEHYGPQFPPWFHSATALVLMFAAALHLVPHPSFATMGAIIMTGMIGGMIGTLLLQENSLWWTRALMGVLPWLGLYFRSSEFNSLMSFWR